DERKELMRQLLEAEALDRELEQELRKYSDSDPKLLEGQKIYSTKAKEAANRWTENIFIFQSYCVGKFNVDRSEFNQNFNISDEMDTLP
ncbi:Meiotic nuclear division protein 1, partial [Dissophora globulifera]